MLEEDAAEKVDEDDESVRSTAALGGWCPEEMDDADEDGGEKVVDEGEAELLCPRPPNREEKMPPAPSAKKGCNVSVSRQAQARSSPRLSSVQSM